MIEAAEQRFESRPSIRLLSHLILNAWPGMIPFNMSMYAMLGVSFFNLFHCISAAFYCHIFSNKRGDRGLGSDQTFFILVLIFF